MRRSAVPAILAVLATTPAAGQGGYSTTSEIPVVRAQYEPLWSGLHARVHAGEQVLITAAGNVCIGHVHRVERRGGFLGIGKKKVVIDHHSLQNASQRPPSFRLALADENDQAPAVQTGAAVTFVVPTAQNAGARTTGRIEAFIPNADPRHHLGYSVQISINSRGRVDVLRSALAQRALTKSEIERDDFFSQRARQQYPELLAEMVVAHAKSDFWKGDPAERKRLLEFSLTLAPTSPVVLEGLGSEYLAQGDYPAAAAALREALRIQRQTNPKNYRGWGDAAYGLADTYFLQNMALTPGDLMEARQLLGEAIRAYSTAPVPLRAEERKSQIRLAEVLTRVRTVEALRQAAQAYARARELVP
jgi:tetratricopeptide (TPR) repeat protein